MKYGDLIDNIQYGEEGSLNLSLEDAQTFAKILLSRGYAVLFTTGDVGDDVNVSWTYAGSPNSLIVAHREKVVFGDVEYLAMLEAGEYEEDEDREGPF